MSRLRFPQNSGTCLKAADRAVKLKPQIHQRPARNNRPEQSDLSDPRPSQGPHPTPLNEANPFTHGNSRYFPKLFTSPQTPHLLLQPLKLGSFSESVPAAPLNSPGSGSRLWISCELLPIHSHKLHRALIINTMENDQSFEAIRTTALLTLSTPPLHSANRQPVEPQPTT